MKNLIIIVHGYNSTSPSNANAICIHNLIEHLEKHFYIDILTTSDNKITYSEKNGKTTSHFIYSENQITHKSLKRWGKSVISYIDDNFDENRLSNLITVSFPFNVNLIGYKLKKKYNHLRWSIYDLDPFSHNKLLGKSNIKFLVRLLNQMTVYHRSDQVLLTHELFDQYNKNILKLFRKKYRDIGIPMMKITNFDNEYNENESVDLLYIGSLYNKYRNPNFMLACLNKFTSDNESYILNLVGIEEKEFMNKYPFVKNKSIKLYGRKSRREITEIIRKSKFLINIGNKLDNQLPSKVLEYIGTGKPIISFNSISNDTGIRYLSKYPKVLILNENQGTNDAILKINKFVHDENNKVDYTEQITEIYDDEKIESVANRIIKSLS